MFIPDLVIKKTTVDLHDDETLTFSTPWFSQSQKIDVAEEGNFRIRKLLCHWGYSKCGILVAKLQLMDGSGLHRSKRNLHKESKRKGLHWVLWVKLLTIEQVCFTTVFYTRKVYKLFSVHAARSYCHLRAGFALLQSFAVRTELASFE